MSELEREVSELKIERKKEGISEAKELSVSREISDLRNEIVALTNKQVEIRKASAGIVLLLSMSQYCYSYSYFLLFL